MRPRAASARSRAAASRRIGPWTLALALVLTLGFVVPVVSTPAHHPAAGSTAARPAPDRVLLPLAPRGPGAALPMIGEERRLLVSPSDPAIVPNDGLRTNITAYSYYPAAPDASFQVAVEEVIGGYEALFGIFDNYELGPVPFFDVFTNQSVHSVHLAYGTSPASAGTAYEFDLRATGGTVWTLRVNGLPLGGSTNTSTFDFGSASATWAGGVGFSEVAIFSNATPVPPVVLSTVLFAFHEPAGWYLPVRAQTVLSGQGSGAWGIEGRAQHPTLAPDEVRSGSAIALVPNATTLWNGGAIAVQVDLTLSSSAAVATVPVTATILVHEIGGPPLPGVPVDLSDALTGRLIPVPVLTDPNGSLALLFTTANVSLVSHDLVTATVAILGYVGSTGTDLVLSPPAQLSVAFSGASPTVELNDTLALAFQATDTSGHPVPSVLFSFSATRGGALALGAQRTGSDGVVVVNFVAGAVPATVTVEATVAEPGFWGHADIVVHVIVPAPTLLDRIGPWVFLGIIVVVVAVPAVLLFYRWRHRPKIPELRLVGGAPDAAPASAGAQEPASSRTPP